MKLNCLFILSFLTFLSTSSITFDSGFLSLSVYAQENNDYPQTLEEAEKIRLRLPKLRGGTGDFFQLDRSHPDYIEMILKAIEDLEKIIPIYQKYGKKEYKDLLVRNLCSYTSEIGHLVSIEEKKLTYCHNSGQNQSIAQMVLLAEQYQNLGKYTEASYSLEKAIEFSEKNLKQLQFAKSAKEWRQIPFGFRLEKELNHIGNLYLMLGSLYLKKGTPNQSKYYYKQALKYFQEEKNYLYKFINEIFPANSSLQNIYRDNWAYRDDLERVTLHYHGNVGSALLGLGRITEAEENLRQSLDYYYRYRENTLQENGSYKDEHLISSIVNPYNNLQQLLIEQEKYEEVLEISEKTLSSSTGKSQLPELKINQIKDFARENNTTIVKYFLFDKIYRDYTLRRNKISILVIQPSGSLHFRQVDANKLYSKQENNQFKYLIVIVAALFISAYLVVKNKNTATMIFLFVVDLLIISNFLTIRQNTEQSGGLFLSGLIYTTLDNFRIKDELTALTKLMKKKYCQSQDRCLKKSYQVLIEPIADLLPQNPEEHVVFIPQEYLSKVPFAALQDDQGKYLIEKHTIRTAPSIGVLKYTNQLPQQKLSPSSVKALVVGNPTMPNIPSGLEWLKDQGEEVIEPLAPLPAAEKEAKEIANILDTQPLIGNQATELAVVRQISDANLIHLATHGLYPINGSNALVLAPSRQYKLDPFIHTNPDDGVLTWNEIKDLDLNAELVVLSACDTALSPIMSDMGFAQPFLANGVPSVVVSLWLVPDAPTSELMIEFYKNLQSIPDKAQALRQAMLTTKDKYPEPVNWAAFTLVGEN